VVYAWNWVVVVVPFVARGPAVRYRFIQDYPPDSSVYYGYTAIDNVTVYVRPRQSATPLRVTSFSPISGPVAGGTNVTMTGYFGEVGQFVLHCWFDGVESSASVYSHSAEKISCTTPPFTGAGMAVISVTTCGLKSLPVANKFRVYKQPTIALVRPNALPLSETVGGAATLTLGPAAGDASFQFFNNLDATVQFSSAPSSVSRGIITVAVPASMVMVSLSAHQCGCERMLSMCVLCVCVYLRVSFCVTSSAIHR
jgi:hypothetical protein